MPTKQGRRHCTCSVNGRNDDGADDDDEKFVPILFIFPNLFFKVNDNS